jgi:drug/metabolite transporter superfamily protein YnfA
MCRYRPVGAVATFLILLVILALRPAVVSAQSNGSIWAAQGGSVPVFFNFSVSGQTFVATILTFGPSGNHGQWFAAFGNTNGVSGTGQLLLPSGLTLTQPPASSFSFQLDQPNGVAGSFTTTGLQSFLSITSGRMVRIFP